MKRLMRLDLTGQRFGKLVAISRRMLLSGGKRRTHWLCRCDCGVEKYIDVQSLIRGLSKSCRCAAREPEFRERISKLLRGRKIPADSLAKRIASQTGKKRSPEIRRRFSAAQRGRVTSDAAKEKMRAKKLAGPKFWLTEEHRAKLRAGQARRIRFKQAATQSTLLSLLTAIRMDKGAM